MKENHIIVNKTARYYTGGELNEKTTRVWFVLHGFGQTAKSFLASFEPLMNDTAFFIAPEALNRFYLTGTGGSVGASWMTKEDRLNEIKDYVHYLDDLYEYFELDQFSAKITILGFSQGAPTITRWVNTTEHRIDNAIVYAGDVAPEILPLSGQSGLRKTKNYLIFGNRDEFITSKVIEKLKPTYTELNFTEIVFDGKHEVKVEVLKGLGI
jgi:predicted esterase